MCENYYENSCTVIFLMIFSISSSLAGCAEEHEGFLQMSQDTVCPLKGFAFQIFFAENGPQLNAQKYIMPFPLQYVQVHL